MTGKSPRPWQLPKAPRAFLRDTQMTLRGGPARRGPGQDRSEVGPSCPHPSAQLAAEPLRASPRRCSLQCGGSTKLVAWPWVVRWLATGPGSGRGAAGTAPACRLAPTACGEGILEVPQRELGTPQRGAEPRCPWEGAPGAPAPSPGCCRPSLPAVGEEVPPRSLCSGPRAGVTCPLKQNKVPAFHTFPLRSVGDSGGPNSWMSLPGSPWDLTGRQGPK